jgi:hypothetical protein
MAVNASLWITLTGVLAWLPIVRNPDAAMVDTLKQHLKKAARMRWAKATTKEKKASASKASRAFWDALTPKQRSAEMKRRAAKRKRNRQTKSRKRALLRGPK